MTGWDRQHPDLTVRPPERVDPAEAALIARLAAAGWTVVDRRAGEDVAVTIFGVVRWQPSKCMVTYRGPTTVAALTEACEAVGA